MVFATADLEEQERRRHILQWARFMIVHLEQGDDVRHLSYPEALTRLRELLTDELARAAD